MTLRNDKRGVFGLTAVQGFFAVVLGIALLAYVIVIIMGTLQSANIIPATTAINNVTIAQTAAIVGNVSTGIAGFFGSISPVYAILAILVIILVLVVLVRVVQAPSTGAAPSL